LAVDNDLSSIPPGIYLPNDKYEVKGIINHLFHSKARYLSVRRDFEILSQKYQKLYINTLNDSKTQKNKTMETIQVDLQQALQQQIENINEQHENERRELHAELKQLTEAYENLEKDNKSLQDQLVAYSSDENKITAVIQKWDEEKSALKKRINEQEYLKEVLEEKKLQITFLQQQLEQRIKNHHLVEQQFRDLGIKFMEVKEELEIHQQTSKELQSTAHDKEREIIFLKEVIQSKTEQAGQAENTIRDLQSETLRFQNELEERKDLINNLHEELSECNEKRLKIEERLEKNQVLLKGFHRKLSDIFEEEAESPVIAMRPLYKNENIEEQFTESVIQ
jgi:chromosome segregation ATPase